MTAPQPCTSCAQDVVPCVAIVALNHDACTQELLADPTPLPPEPGLLLHVGDAWEGDRWVVAPLGTRSGEVLARQLKHPHAHRPHVCATVPDAWLEQDQAVPA